MRLSNLIKKDLIIKDITARNRDELIKEVVNFLKKKDLITNEKEITYKLIEREKQATTAVADGIAIPHCKSKNLEEPLISLAISKEGIDFNSTNKKPTFIFFFVISSEDQPTKHLQVLALIAQLIKKSENLAKKILKATDEQEILNIIKEEEISPGGEK
ncbi:MAG: PTS sugar transporter subunit IIA [Candidatus Aminicenantia bacterium]